MAPDACRLGRRNKTIGGHTARYRRSSPTLAPWVLTARAAGAPVHFVFSSVWCHSQHSSPVVCRLEASRYCSRAGGVHPNSQSTPSEAGGEAREASCRWKLVGVPSGVCGPLRSGARETGTRVAPDTTNEGGSAFVSRARRSALRGRHLDSGLSRLVLSGQRGEVWANVLGRWEDWGPGMRYLQKEVVAGLKLGLVCWTTLHWLVQPSGWPFVVEASAKTKVSDNLALTIRIVRWVLRSQSQL